MEVRLTEEQSAAVKAPLAENLVSAAAGSGKTKVLSERIASRIKGGDTSICRLLVVTFTRAAAAQMKERIYGALRAEYDKTGDRRLRDELSMVAASDICTIDSFCINIVRKNFFRLGVPSDFAIADSSEMKILADDVTDEVLEEFFEGGDEGFLSLADSLGKGKGTAALSAAVQDVYAFSSSFADPEGWLDAAAEKHNPTSEKNRELKVFLLEEAKSKLQSIEKSLSDCQRRAEDVGLSAHAKVFESERGTFRKLFGNFSEDEILSGLSNFSFLSFAGKKTPPELAHEKDALLDCHKDAKDEFKTAAELCDAYFSESGAAEPEVRALVRCVKRFRQRFIEEKIARRELEFSDCEYLALRVLTEDGEAADELRDKYDEIYIDEYQDTNPLQDALFTAVSKKARGEPNLFIVGDVKQSIYRFRHSDPKVFSDKIKSFSESAGQRKMILSKNFRSRRDVIDSVNSVFERVMRQDTGGVDYAEGERLVFGASYYVECSLDKSEIYILKKDAADEEELKSTQAEALIAANKIKKMVEEKFPVSGDGGRMRPVTYSDFAVLTRALTGKVDMITKVFDLCGVPTVCSAERDFYTATEIKTVAAVLRAVDNPRCDIPLAAAMRSPFFLFDENELMEIRQDDRNCDFYENVKRCAEGSSELAKRCVRLLSTLSRWRKKSSVMGTEEFISFILDESGYYSFVGALPGGAARQDNLRALMRTAAGFERTRCRGLYNFVKYLEKTAASGAGKEPAEDLSGDAVKVMTIHKSKGLEFPVVIVIGCSSPFNTRDTSGSFIRSRERGIGLLKINGKRRISYKPPEYRAVALGILNELKAEQMRLLYVAMTRAEEKLILIGSAKDPDELIEDARRKAARTPDSYEIRKMNDFLSYVLPSAVESDFWDVEAVNELPCILTEEEEVPETFEEPDWGDEVLRRLSYNYVGPSGVPSKLSVSEIKRLRADDAAPLYAPIGRRKPAFYQEGEKRLTASERGTAYHRVMELIDFNESDVDSAMARMVEKRLLTREEADAVNPADIKAFLDSPIGEALRHARRVWREASFTVSMASADILDEGGEDILVQGVIDCLFEDESGGLILLDYKTDRYDDPEKVVQKYKKQLELYENAVFMKFSKPCDKKYLYLFHKGDIMCVRGL